MKKALYSYILAVSLISFTPLVYASDQNAPPPSPGGGSNSGGPREACRADAMTFCHDTQPGGGRIRDCLEDHYKDISDACYTALKNAPPPPLSPNSDEQDKGQSAPNKGPPPKD